MNINRSTLYVLPLLMAWSAASASAGELDFQAASEFSRNHNGHAVLVMIDGKIVFEQYHHGWSARKPHRLASGTKSFWGVAAMAMVEDGLLTLDERVAATIPAWKASPRKSRVTVRHLLNMTSGLIPGKRRIDGPGSPDNYAAALALPATRGPGAAFRYGPSSFYVFGELMKRKLSGSGQTPLDYLRRRILDPIGLRIGRWRHDEAGNPHIPNGAYLTARQWIRFGEFIRLGGRWGDERIIGQDLLARCFQGSDANSGYGLGFWLNRPGGQGLLGSTGRADVSPPLVPAAPNDLIMALGAGKQRLYILPSRHMVVLHYGESIRPRGFRFENRFLNLLLNRR